MANIRSYDTPALSLRPSETGVEAAAGAARRMGAFYNQRAGATDELARNTESLGQFEGSLITQTGNRAASALQAAGDEYVKYEDNKQISHGAATASDMFVNLEKQWNDQLKSADPNDPSVAAKFKETVLQPALEQFGENFTTENSQKFAEGITQRYRQHFDTKISADMSTMAGIAAKENAAKTINSLSSAVYMDPTSLDTAIDTLKHSAGHIVDSSPTIDAETGARVKSELNQKGVESLVKSAVSGMIEKNPNIDLDAIQKKYPEYINGGELKMFQRAAQRQGKTDAAMAKQDALAQRQLADQKVHADSAKIIADKITFDAQGRPIVDPSFFKASQDIAKGNPNAPTAATTAMHMLTWGESQQNKEQKIISDPAVVTKLDDGMFSADHPTTRIDLMKAQTDGKLSDHDFQTRLRLVNELEQTPLKGPVYQDTMKAVKDRLIIRDPLLKGPDIEGTNNYAKFVQTFIPQYIAKSRAGTLEPNALDVKDPNSMISKAMEPYKRPLPLIMQSAVTMNGGVGSTTPRMVGDVPVPAALGGVAALQYNKAKGLWRDQTTGTIYDAKGAEVK